MKWTILGFSQEEMIKANMDILDAAILRYFIDFKDDGEMVTRIIDNKLFYWLKYDNLLSEMPSLKIKSKDALRRRLKKLVECKILDSRCLKEKGKGTFSFYAVGSNYKNLIKKTYPSDLKVVGGTTKKSDGCDLKVVPKDTSTKDTISSSSSKEQLSEIYKLYQELGFGLPNKVVAEMIEDDIKKYSKEWFMEALKIAVKENKLKLSYVEGILQNWKRNGGMNNGKAGDKDGGRSMSKSKYNNKQNKSTAGEDRAEQYDLSDL